MTYDTGPMRAKLAKVTPGPWQVNSGHIYGSGPERHLIALTLTGFGRLVSDRDCIVALRNDAAAMLDTIDAQAEEIARMREALKPLAIRTPT